MYQKVDITRLLILWKFDLECLLALLKTEVKTQSQLPLINLISIIITFQIMCGLINVQGSGNSANRVSEK